MSEPDDDAGSPLRELGTDEPLESALPEDGRALLDFAASWCGPCRLMEPVLAELDAETAAPVLKVDVETHPVLAADHDVRAVPTYVVLEAGEERARFVGPQNKDVLRDALGD